jgi:hypothetical protein
VGAQLGELGYRLLAADALADAAVLAAAVGEPADGYASQARELFAACSIVSPYGDPLAAVGAATASA